MTCAYKYTETKNGKQESKYVILHSMETCDFDRVLHSVGVRLGLAHAIHDTSNGITTDQILETATPEMFAKYGVTMIQTDSCMDPAEQPRLIINRYELETYRSIEERCAQKFRKYASRAAQLAKRLGTQKDHGHPYISKWGYTLLLPTACSWARQRVEKEDAVGAAGDMDEFFERKLREAKPH